MKIFETIHLVLLAGFVIGVPVAASAHRPDQTFSLAQACWQAAVAAGILFALLVLNFLLARLWARLR